MDFYIISPNMQNRVIESIINNNSNDFMVEYVGKKNFALHFKADKDDFNVISNEIKNRMKKIYYYLVQKIVKIYQAG